AALPAAGLVAGDSTIEVTIDAEPAQDILSPAAESPVTPAQARAALEAATRAAAPTDVRFAPAAVRIEDDRFRVLQGRTGDSNDPESVVDFAEAGGGGNLAEILNLASAEGAIVNVQQCWVGSACAPGIGFRSVVVEGVDDMGAT